ncbi:hypothetical protein Bbelb_205460 [Branchiostoma belcheri]|nr:hypothetical protein Bbelb_205460 [Branchiostoma belcheri]
MGDVPICNQVPAPGSGDGIQSPGLKPSGGRNASFLNYGAGVGTTVRIRRVETERHSGPGIEPLPNPGSSFKPEAPTNSAKRSRPIGRVNPFCEHNGGEHEALGAENGRTFP